MTDISHFFYSRYCGALLLVFGLLCGGNSCSKNEELLGVRGRQSFSGPFQVGAVAGDNLNEVSGIAAGMRNAGIIWAHKDSGDEPRIFALTEKGKLAATFYLEGVKAVDWEDMAAGGGPVPGRKYLYIADIGDNQARRSHVMVYRLEEPLLTGNRKQLAGQGQQAPESDRSFLDTVKKEAIDVFFLKYEDGPRDAETFLEDPLSEYVYVISKREPEAGIYRSKLPAHPEDTLVLQRTGSISHTGMTGGDISPDGSEILLKNYRRLFYWPRAGEEPLGQALERRARRIPYVPEPQGEALTWKKDGSGFFTLSEEVLGIEAVLYWHRRK